MTTTIITQPSTTEPGAYICTLSVDRPLVGRAIVADSEVLMADEAIDFIKRELPGRFSERELASIHLAMVTAWEDRRGKRDHDGPRYIGPTWCLPATCGRLYLSGLTRHGKFWFLRDRPET